MKKETTVGAVLALLGSLAVALPALGQGQVLLAPEVKPLVHAGVSAPLRSLPPLPVPEQRREIPLRPIPRRASTGQTDPVVQSSTSVLAATTAGLNFEGVGQGAYGYKVTVAPPDTNGSVGATQYVQFVNLAFAVFDKSTGALLYGPAAGNTLWQNSSLSACAATNDGDVLVRYDQAAGRWWLSQLSFSQGPPYYLCIAISATSDATGAYYLYALEFANDLPDYPKLGVWPDAYYTSFNLFFGGILFVGAQACALDRGLMLQNLDATVQCFTVNNPSLLPSDLDGSTAPPAGSPDFYMDLGSNALNLWRFHVDFSNSANSSLTGPVSIPVAGFNEACGGGTCIPQPGTSQQLDSLADRLMYRLAYRNFGDHEALVATHSVGPSGKKHNSSGPPSSLRWYEVRNPNGSPVVFQQGTFAPDSSSRWMGSIAMDKVGDLAVGYSVSSSSVHPSIRYSGRTPSDPLGTLEAETSIIEGAGSQLSNLSRWGDYSGMSVDPVDDCTFYYTTEYLQADGTFNWNTRIASFKFPGCQ